MDNNFDKLLHDAELASRDARIKFKHIDTDVQVRLWWNCYCAERTKGNDVTYCINGILRAITGQERV